MALIQLIYTSTATRAMDEAELDQIVATARSRNPDNGITGMLFYADGHFMQVLEGEEALVDATLERVRRDPRHTDVTVTERSAISERSFAEWSMGLKCVGQDEARADVAASRAAVAPGSLAAAILGELTRAAG